MNTKSTTAPADDVGLRCKACGRRGSRVIYTRAARCGRVTRRRECSYCKARFTTNERRVG